MEEKPIRQEESAEYWPPNRGSQIAIVLLAVGLCAVFIYALVEHHSMRQLAASRSELSAQLNQQQDQLQTLSQKLLAAETAAAPAPAPVTSPAVNSSPEEQAPEVEPRSVQHHVRRHTTVARTRHTDDAWRKKVQSQLNEQQELLAEQRREIQDTKDSVAHTRTDLENNLRSTRDDLNGAIAKNHDEVVALEKKGERNFYEFDLPKSKYFKREGPMSISVRKANAKHQYCDLVMIVNDSEVSKKHVNLYEPVLFYPEGYSQPLQLVINSIDKHSARGYVSEPKYKPSELAGGATTSSGSVSGSAGQTAGGSSSTVAASLKRRSEPQQ